MILVDFFLSGSVYVFFWIRIQAAKSSGAAPKDPNYVSCRSVVYVKIFSYNLFARFCKKKLDSLLKEVLNTAAKTKST